MNRGKNSTKGTGNKLLLPEPNSLMVEERRQQILSHLNADGRVIVGALATIFGVSQITIRKDLDSLDERGVLRRSHGGALPASLGTSVDLSIQEKQTLNAPEKERIAAAAMKLVEEAGCIMLDSGTTTTAIAKNLKKFHALTIITNAINIATELAATNFEIILTGGSLRKNSFSLVGPLAEDVLQEVHADVLFLGVDGFDLQIGLSTPSLLEARVNRAMINSAKKVVVVCDSTKFSRRSLSHISPISAIHHVITDTGLPDSIAQELKRLDIEVTLV